MCAGISVRKIHLCYVKDHRRYVGVRVCERGKERSFWHFKIFNLIHYEILIFMINQMTTCPDILPMITCIFSNSTAKLNFSFGL